jgi:hypothetical protein
MTVSSLSDLYSYDALYRQEASGHWHPSTIGWSHRFVVIAVPRTLIIRGNHLRMGSPRVRYWHHLQFILVSRLVFIYLFLLVYI